MTDQELVSQIAQEVISRLRGQLSGSPAASPAAAPAIQVSDAGDYGVFSNVDDAVKAAAIAQERVAAMSLDERDQMISIIRRICLERSEELARMELAETKIGRLDHKIAKLTAMRQVPGVEALRVAARTDASGLCVIERAPWGVIGMVLPATHSVPTMVCNAISILAGGNTALFNPHPAGAKCAAYALKLINREIEKALGVKNVITTVSPASIETAEAVFHHPDIALIVVTGGPGVVKAASKSGKRVVAGGPGNPPVVVDETADLDQAARCIIQGGSFDNGVLCIGEKQIFVVKKVADAFIEAMKRAGAFMLDFAAVEQLTGAAFTYDGGGRGCGRAHVKKELVGKDVSVLAAAAGVKVPTGTDLLFGETKEDHPFVQEEQMMPFVPVIRVGCIDAAIEAAFRSEHNYRHTAIIHSNSFVNVTKMAKKMNTTLFVHNAPSTGALGVDGPGYFSYTIATPTGEGVTTPLTFTRERQIAFGAGLLRIT